MSPTPADMPGAQAAPEPSTEPAAAPTPTPTPADPPQPAETPKAAPPWGSDEDFDPDKAWKLIQNLRQENAEFKQKAQPVLDEYERLRRASQSELDTAREDLAKLNSEIEAWRSNAIAAQAKSLAADRFIDADAALALIGDTSGFLDGNAVDTAKISAALDQLAEAKPHLVKQAPQPPGFTPNRGQGQSGTGQMPPLDAQIKAAQERGDLMASIALKQQKFYQARS